MLKLTVEEGYAYDYLSILQIKFDKLKTENSKTLFLNCSIDLKNQIGEEAHNKIINSIEYKDLCTSNENTFYCVEQARYGNISSKEVDEANMQRYINKTKLQKKFFNTTSLEEKS
jgi:hypothetical protein